MVIEFDAAIANLRLAHELNKGDLPLSRAFWMLGGHHLARGDYYQAEQCFGKSETFAAAANEAAGRLLARGFAVMASLLASRDETGAEALQCIRAQLARLDHGKQFVQQVDTAWNVFS